MTSAVDRLLIGLTGNIATGKSTVGGMLQDLGAAVIDADKVVHQVMRRGEQVYEQIVALFGTDIVASDGEIDRRRLGRIVFNDAALLSRLEQLVHPATRQEVWRRLTQAEEWAVVIEAIKLIEAGWHTACDQLWVTTCPREQQLARLLAGRSLTPEEAQKRVAAQPPQIEKVRLADVVIDTSGTLTDTRRQVRLAWRAISKGEGDGHDGTVHGLSS